MPVGLSRLSNKSVYIKTGDVSFLDKIYVAFISGALATNPLYQPQMKQHFELARFKIIGPNFLVANHSPMIVNYGL